MIGITGQELEWKGSHPPEPIYGEEALLDSVHELRPEGDIAFNGSFIDAFASDDAILEQAYANGLLGGDESIDEISNELALKNQRGGY